MTTTSGKLLHAELTDGIIGGFYTVNRTFEFGFLEAVDKNAMAVALGRRGLEVGLKASSPPSRSPPERLAAVSLPRRWCERDRVC
jgi:hypothetical protein